MTFKHLFTDHPASVNETYLEHMAMSASFAGALFLAAGAALVHAILPFLFDKTASAVVGRLHSSMVTNRIVRPAPDSRQARAGKAS